LARSTARNSSGKPGTWVRARPTGRWPAAASRLTTAWPMPCVLAGFTHRVAAENVPAARVGGAEGVLCRVRRVVADDVLAAAGIRAAEGVLCRVRRVLADDVLAAAGVRATQDVHRLSSRLRAHDVICHSCRVSLRRAAVTPSSRTVASLVQHLVNGTQSLRASPRRRCHLGKLRDGEGAVHLDTAADSHVATGQSTVQPADPDQPFAS
jgi:hypothetical protein